MIGLMLGLCLVTASEASEPRSFTEEMRQEMRMEHPALAQRVDEMRPIRNRAGGWFFPGPDLTHPVAQAFIQERILSRRDEASVRVALVYALDAEHRFSWQTITSEEASVRRAMLHGYKGLESTNATEVLRHALRDSSPLVRAEAARLVGYRKDDVGLARALLTTLQDDSAEVRGLSARSLGWLQVSEAFDPITGLLDDVEPTVRASAVRALSKIAPDRARTLPQLQTMTSDVDPGVQRAVRRIVQP